MFITRFISLCIFVAIAANQNTECHSIKNSRVQSTPESDTYVAGVVEYQSSRGGTNEENLQTNLENYLRFIKDAQEQNVDVLVFPESTLTSLSTAWSVPIRSLNDVSPCSEPAGYQSALIALSCAAQDANLYLVVNVREILDCTLELNQEECPDNEVYHFNTNVVFDRSGRIVDRYRKINLFLEAGSSPAFDQRLGKFETDFGVTFGHYICFDLLFQIPALQLVTRENITDIIFPTMWFSEMPFLTAVQVQQGFAHANNVNFLAAGASNVNIGSTGSGIYSGKAGSLISVMAGTNYNQLLVATVPKIPGKISGFSNGPTHGDVKEMNALFLKRDHSLDLANSQFVEETLELQRIELSNGDIKCDFEIRLKSLPTSGSERYIYRAMAFDGVRTFDGAANGGVSFCSVVACSSELLDSCARRFDNSGGNNTLNFEILTINAKLPAQKWDTATVAHDTLYMPTILLDTITPTSSNFYEFEKKNANDTTVVMKLKEDEVNLLAFGFWGRVFDKDGLPITEV